MIQTLKKKELIQTARDTDEIDNERERVRERDLIQIARETDDKDSESNKGKER